MCLEIFSLNASFSKKMQKNEEISLSNISFIKMFIFLKTTNLNKKI